MFESLELLPLAPRYAAVARCAADPRPHKIDLVTGILRNADGEAPVPPVVRKAEERILADERSKDYLDPLGDADFRRAAQELLIGSCERAVTIQAPGGVAALRLAAEFLRGRGRVHVPRPTWPNHDAILAAAGLATADLPWADLRSWTLRIDDLVASLHRAGEGEVVLLQPCCHNPTGLDPAASEWTRVIEAIVRRKLLPLLDIAFFGFARGLDEDLAPLKLFRDAKIDFLLTVSCSKAFGLYRERVGSLTAVGSTAEGMQRALSQLRRLVRPLWSTAPAHGARVVARILGDADLRTDWRAGLEATRGRLAEVRRRLADGLARRRPGLDWNHLVRQGGIFAPLGLDPAALQSLREKQAIHLPDSGWLNVAALPERRIEDFLDAVAPLAAVSYKEKL